MKNILSIYYGEFIHKCGALNPPPLYGATMVVSKIVFGRQRATAAVVTPVYSVYRQDGFVGVLGHTMW